MQDKSVTSTAALEAISSIIRISVVSSPSELTRVQKCFRSVLSLLAQSKHLCHVAPPTPLGETLQETEVSFPEADKSRALVVNRRHLPRSLTAQPDHKSVNKVLARSLKGLENRYPALVRNEETRVTNPERALCRDNFSG